MKKKRNHQRFIHLLALIDLNVKKIQRKEISITQKYRVK